MFDDERNMDCCPVLCDISVCHQSSLMDNINPHYLCKSEAATLTTVFVATTMECITTSLVDE